MIRLHFLVEGPSEQRFVDQLIAAHLEPFEVFSTTSRLDGVTTFEKLSRELRRFFLDRSSSARFTTMFDYYKLPRHFPGDSDDLPRDPVERVAALEMSFAASMDEWRLVPYIQVHEFEALLFTDISSLSSYHSEHRTAIRELELVRPRFPTPEHIDQKQPPSKRILEKVPGYDKPTAGAGTAIEIGLAKLRSECLHFNDWIGRLEVLGR
jgi:hypothetical protein